MTQGLTGRDLQEAARKLKLSQRDISKATGLSIRTINRVFNSDGHLDARQSTLDTIAKVVGLGPAARLHSPDPLLVIDLPPEKLYRARMALPDLYAMLEIASVTRRKSDVVEQMAKINAKRTTSVSLRDNDLYFDWIGDGIRWAGNHVRGARVLDLADPAVARAAAERYWKALIANDPVFQYVRTPLGLEFVALTVPTDDGPERGLVTITSLGRPQF
jgi:transcriptional regulator with XRE-family HTH domain